MNWVKFWQSIALAFSRTRGGETGHDEPGMSAETFVDDEGWLHGDGIVHHPSVRSSKLTADEPLGIVWHYTGMDVGHAKSLVKRIRKYKRGVDRPASWHLLIAWDGTVYQSVSMLRGSWHCSQGRLVDEYGKRHRTNASSIGIELEGRGKEFSAKQIAAAERVTKAIVEAYDITKANAALDHSALDRRLVTTKSGKTYPRRSDAGKVWAQHRATFLERVFQGSQQPVAGA